MPTTPKGKTSTDLKTSEQLAANEVSIKQEEVVSQYDEIPDSDEQSVNSAFYQSSSSEDSDSSYEEICFGNRGFRSLKEKKIDPDKAFEGFEYISAEFAKDLLPKASTSDFHSLLTKANNSWKSCVDIARYFNENQSSQNLTADQIFRNGDTPLLLAAKANNHCLVKYFCIHGVNLEQEDQRHNTALKVAVQNQNEKIVKCLIEFGAEPEIFEKQLPDLTPAIYHTLRNFRDFRLTKSELPHLKTEFSSHELETKTVEKVLTEAELPYKRSENLFGSYKEELPTFEKRQLNKEKSARNDDKRPNNNIRPTNAKTKEDLDNVR